MTRHVYRGLFLFASCVGDDLRASMDGHGDQPGEMPPRAIVFE